MSDSHSPFRLTNGTGKPATPSFGRTLDVKRGSCWMALHFADTQPIIRVHAAGVISVGFPGGGSTLIPKNAETSSVSITNSSRTPPAAWNCGKNCMDWARRLATAASRKMERNAGPVGAVLGHGGTMQVPGAQTPRAVSTSQCANAGGSSTRSSGSEPIFWSRSCSSRV
jgi:hypothetical protein